MNDHERQKAIDEIQRICEEIMERPNFQRMLDALVTNCATQGTSKEFAIATLHMMMEATGAAATIAVIKAKGWNPEEFRLTTEQLEEKAQNMQAQFTEHGMGNMMPKFLQEDEA
jgi:hypothetical protein